MPVNYPWFNCSKSIKDSEETTAKQCLQAQREFFLTRDICRLSATYVDLTRHMWTKCDLNTGGSEHEFVMLPESVRAPFVGAQCVLSCHRNSNALASQITPLTIPAP